jgi:hypothetical protein
MRIKRLYETILTFYGINNITKKLKNEYKNKESG